MSEYIAQAKEWFTRSRIEEVLGDLGHIWSFVRRKTKRFTLNMLYWGGVVCVGLVMSGATLALLGENVWPGEVYAQSAAVGLGPISTATNLGSSLLSSGASGARATISNAFDSSISLFFGFSFLVVSSILGGLSAILAFILQVIIGYPWSPFWSGAPLSAGGAAGGIAAAVGEGIFQADNYSTGGFINISAVIFGWRVIRDVANLFFAIILLIIALATVLNLEAYKWQELLKKLVIYAVLINFSRTICGIFTDAATVVMATFGAALANNWVGAILGNLDMTAIGKFGNRDNTEVLADQAGIIELLSALALSMYAYGTAIVIFAAFIVVLLIRIVMLWFLIILSPLAYVTRILPFTMKYSSEWWGKFGQYVLVGPLVTFFLWLTIFILNGGSVPVGLTGLEGTGPGGEARYGGSINALQDRLSDMETPDGQELLNANFSEFPGLARVQTPSFIANFLLVTIMLFASLQLALRLASEAGKAAGAASDFAKDLRGAAIARGAIKASGFARNRFKKAPEGSTRASLWNTADAIANTLNNPIDTAKDFWGAFQEAMKNPPNESGSGTRRQIIQDALSDKGTGMAARLNRATGYLTQMVTPQAQRQLEYKGFWGSLSAAVTEVVPLTKASREQQAERQELNDEATEIKAEKDAIDTFAKTSPELTALKGRDSGIIKKIKDAKSDEEVRRILQNTATTPEVDRAREEYEAAQRRVNEGDFDAVHVNVDDIQGEITARVDELRNARQNAANAGDNAVANQFQQAIRALTSASGAMSVADLKKLLTPSNIRKADLDNYRVAEPMRQMKAIKDKAQTAAQQEVQARKEALDAALDQVAITPAALAAAQQLQSRSQAVKEKEMNYEGKAAFFQAKSLQPDPSILQAENAYLDERAKRFEGLDPRMLRTEMIKNLDGPDSTTMTMAYLRYMMKNKMLGMGLRDHIQTLIDQTKNEDKGSYADLFKKAVEKRIENGEEGYENLVDANGKVKLTDSAESLKLVGDALLRDKLGMSMREVMERFNDISATAFANGENQYMAMYSRSPDGTIIENTREQQAEITQSILGNKNAAALLRELTESQMFHRDRAMNKVELNPAALRLLRSMSESLRDERIVKVNMPSGVLKGLADNFYDEVKKALNNDESHQFLKMLQNAKTRK